MLIINNAYKVEDISMEATCVDHYAIVYPDYLLTAKGLILMILNAVLLRQTKSKTSTLPGIGRGGSPKMQSDIK